MRRCSIFRYVITEVHMV